jgi:hypothetical protein
MAVTQKGLVGSTFGNKVTVPDPVTAFLDEAAKAMS